MVCRMSPPAAALIILVASATAIGSVTAKGQQSALNQQVAKLYQAGKYAEATDIAKRVLGLVERQFGVNHTNTASALNNLALLYQAQSGYAEAERLYRRSLAIRKKVLGPEHPAVATSLNNLADLLKDQGRFGDAEPLYKQSLAISEKVLGSDHLDFATTLNNVADLYREQSRYEEAEQHYKRAIAIMKSKPGPESMELGFTLDNLAELYRIERRYLEAEPLYKQSLAISEKVLGSNHPDIAVTLNNLAAFYRAQGRYSEAEQLYKRSLAIKENADPRGIATTLNNLAKLYRIQGRYAEAEPLHKRSLTISEMTLGPDHPDVAASLIDLAELYRHQGRYAEAEPLLTRSLAISEKVDHNNILVASAVTNLAEVYLDQDKYTEAEPLLTRALGTTENILGPDHPFVAAALNNLATLYRTQGRFSEAEPLYRRSLTLTEKTQGSDHPDVAIVLSNLASLHFLQGDWARAVHYWRGSTGVIIRRTQRGSFVVGEALTGKKRTEAEQLGGQFKNLVKAVYRVVSDQQNDTNLDHEMFESAQWAQSSKAAESLSQMAARGAKSDTKLATLVRERQDLVVEWQGRDEARSTALAQSPDKRKQEKETKNVARLTAIDTRIASIDEELAVNFPDYAALASPVPLSVEDVQKQLGHDEALVLLLDTPEARPTPEETFIWVVTNTDMRWVRSELGTLALTREVLALRCGLDSTLWREATNGLEPTEAPKGSAQHELHCDALTGAKPSLEFIGLASVPRLPFDAARAHALYKALFYQIEDLIKDKRLLILPSGPLTQLPFQVLVTEPPNVAPPSAFIDYRDVAWLTRKHAITVLPAVSSLKALRELAKGSLASEPYIGFGNPLLDGEPEKFKEDEAAAKLAREKRCDPVMRQRVASSLRGGTRVMTRTNGGIPDVADIRRWAPLPETADELCDVAHDLGVDPKTHLYLGTMATETKIKQLSAVGALAKYKIIHFATHGAVAGQVSRLSEPGLLLTPPDKASETDDGYLAASDIAGLKLDADWVILSACNTAAAGAQDAEPLSGLARAFFYAGARSLLVSHWEVASDSTVRLITKTMAELKSAPKIGRAEALRRSMLAMITAGKDYEAHPAFWAPFVLVGEGAVAR